MALKSKKKKGFWKDTKQSSIWKALHTMPGMFYVPDIRDTICTAGLGSSRCAVTVHRTGQAPALVGFAV